MVTVYEVFKRADGTVERIGNSVECKNEAEAEKLVATGDYKFLSAPTDKGEKPKKKAKKKESKE